MYYVEYLDPEKIQSCFWTEHIKVIVGILQVPLIEFEFLLSFQIELPSRFWLRISITNLNIYVQCFDAMIVTYKLYPL